jgi:uncharacterized protein (DUF1697 family)
MRYACLLRAVNVGGRQVKMEPLRKALTDKGYENVRTLLASGNVVLDSKIRTAAKLETQLDADILEATGVASEAIVRSAADWPAIVEANPFPKETKTASNFMTVLFCRTAPDAAAIAAYMKTYEGPEKLKIHGREIYIFFPDGQGRSELKLPKKAYLGTVRNWNTVLKLEAMLKD